MPSTKEILEQIIAVAKEYDSELSVLEDVNKNMPEDDLYLDKRIPHKAGNILTGIKADIHFHIRKPANLTLQAVTERLFANLSETSKNITFILENATHPKAIKFLDIRQRILDLAAQIEPSRELNQR